MIRWRQERALRLTLGAQEDALRTAYGMMRDSTGTQDETGLETGFADKFQRLLEQYTGQLIDGLPPAVVELPANEDADDEKNLGGSLLQWIRSEAEQVSGPLAALLGSAAVAGCIAAYAIWNEGQPVDMTPSSGLLAQLRNWAKGEAARVLEDITAILAKGISRLVQVARQETLSVAALVTRIKTYLEECIEGLMQTALTEIRKVLGKGQWEANKSLGADTKYWYTARDGNVCENCLANEAQKAIPIEQPFKSGHQYPPAHAYCRCHAMYAGVTRDSAPEAY